MSASDANRRLVLAFFKQISGREKDRFLLTEYVADEKLIDTLVSLEAYIPAYRISIEEVTSEGPKVSLQAIAYGDTSSLIKDCPYAEIPFALSCRIEKGKITDHWFIADQLAFLKQIQ